MAFGGIEIKLVPTKGASNVQQNMTNDATSHSSLEIYQNEQRKKQQSTTQDRNSPT